MTLRGFAPYLTRPRSGRSRVDPVARFHLGNGARLERINWLGNTAPRAHPGILFGIMVNYLYDQTHRGQPRGLRAWRTIVRSAEVDALLSAEPVLAPEPRGRNAAW